VGEVTEHTICVEVLSTTFFIKKSATYQICVLILHVKYPLFLPDFNGDFRKTFVYQIKKKKSVPWQPSCCMLTDRYDEANSRFSKFYERAVKGTVLSMPRRASSY